MLDAINVVVNPDLDCSSWALIKNINPISSLQLQLITTPAMHASHTHTLSLSNCTGETSVCVSVKVKRYTSILCRQSDLCFTPLLVWHMKPQRVYITAWAKLRGRRKMMMISETSAKRSDFCRLACHILEIL